MVDDALNDKADEFGDKIAPSAKPVQTIDSVPLAHPIKSLILDMTRTRKRSGIRQATVRFVLKVSCPAVDHRGVCVLVVYHSRRWMREREEEERSRTMEIDMRMLLSDKETAERSRQERPN